MNKAEGEVRSFEKFDDPILVYFQSSQKREVETWLRQHRPGSKVGAFIREATLRAIRVEGAATAPNVVPLHLGESERASIMDAAQELGHRDLGIFAEELLLRIAKRTPDEIISIFRGKENSASETDIGRKVLSIFEDFQNRQQDSDEAKSA